MMSCPSCGRENPDDAKFCMECAAVLGSARPLGEERKFVTCLFCDLVGFTAASEFADPEDVDQMLASYFAAARAAIEFFGGVVEKFIGDAVVGVFGVPAAHEDDPERAVRAGLQITEDAEGLEAVGGEPLKLRVGINSGEALVRLGVSPASGEGFLTGDAINTASRIQSVAPEMGVAVGLGTFETTAALFDYDELEPARLKGKSELVRVFHARSSRARPGIPITRTHDTPFIGRKADFAQLKAIFDKMLATTSLQLVTVVGEPGLGKSRIVTELGSYVNERPDLITWRQGRCLPYGEGITFWALGEILKAHAGILESDPPDVATSKLDHVLPSGEERPWFRQRLLPLLGIEVTSTAERDELFTVWRRFLESMARDHPTVLVFEDLHWADEPMLAFLEYLAERAEGSLLVVGTARPDLYERHPDFTKALENVNTIRLSPLTEGETGHLVSALLETVAIPADLQEPILDRVGGNPLFAEEFARLLKDRELVVRKGAGWELPQGTEIPFPDSVQALIAARLDTLSADTKSMLADAAVVGKVFWAGAIAQMGGRDPANVLETLRELSRKEFVRPSHGSSIEGEVEYAFRHVLARDVVYGQLPRVSRASRHVAAAHWIESKAPERLEDLANVLAYHYATALELAQAAGQRDQATELQAPALRFLSLAGQRALSLDSVAALSHFERALMLAPEGHSERPRILARFGEAAFQAGHLSESVEALEEAITAFRAAGDLPAAARTMSTLSSVLYRLGDPRWTTLPAEGLALLEPLGPSPELVGVLTGVGRVEALQGTSENAAHYAERAIAVAEGLGIRGPARTLGLLGMARCHLGDREGLEDYREAIALATELGESREAASLYANLGADLWDFESVGAALEVFREGIGYAETRGLTLALEGLKVSTMCALHDAGEIDEALLVAAEVAEQAEASGDVIDLSWARAVQASIWTLRGQRAQAAGVLDWLESTCRKMSDVDYSTGGLCTVAMARAALGQDQAARELLELEQAPGFRGSITYYGELPEMVRTALAIGDRDLAERMVAGLTPTYPSAERALGTASAVLTEARGDLQAAADAYANAANGWERFGAVADEGYALLGQGRCLLGIARPTEAAPVLQHAREIFERLGAAPALRETDALLQQATALSS